MAAPGRGRPGRVPVGSVAARGLDGGWRRGASAFPGHHRWSPRHAACARSTVISEGGQPRIVGTPRNDRADEGGGRRQGSGRGPSPEGRSLFDARPCRRPLRPGRRPGPAGHPHGCGPWTACSPPSSAHWCSRMSETTGTTCTLCARLAWCKAAGTALPPPSPNATAAAASWRHRLRMPKAGRSNSDRGAGPPPQRRPCRPPNPTGRAARGDGGRAGWECQPEVVPQ